MAFQVGPYSIGIAVVDARRLLAAVVTAVPSKRGRQKVNRQMRWNDSGGLPARYDCQEGDGERHSQVTRIWKEESSCYWGGQTILKSPQKCPEKLSSYQPYRSKTQSVKMSLLKSTCDHVTTMKPNWAKPEPWGSQKGQKHSALTTQDVRLHAPPPTSTWETRKKGANDAAKNLWRVRSPCWWIAWPPVEMGVWQKAWNAIWRQGPTRTLWNNWTILI